MVTPFFGTATFTSSELVNSSQHFSSIKSVWSAKLSERECMVIWSAAGTLETTCFHNLLVGEETTPSSRENTVFDLSGVTLTMVGYEL